ncbi:hypothetical protein A8B78_06105 [Jannaschia sp. EhC01]|nr:hypothetical protein A8B78_06105 [Jannaschia sp. EhC01]
MIFKEVQPWVRRFVSKAYHEPAIAKFRSPKVALDIAADIIEQRQLDCQPMDFCIDQVLAGRHIPPSKPGDLWYDFVSAYSAHWKDLAATYDMFQALTDRHMSTDSFAEIVQETSQKAGLPLDWRFAEERYASVWFTGLAVLDIPAGGPTVRFSFRTSPDFHSPLTANLSIHAKTRQLVDTTYNKLLALPTWALRNTLGATHSDNAHVAIGEIVAFTRLIVDEFPSFPVDL